MKSFLLKLFLSLFLGAITGVLMGIFNINESWLFPITLAIVLIVFLPGTFKTWFSPIHLINQGKIDEAINIFTKVQEKYKNRPLYKNQALMNLANCYHLKGEFDKSLALLDQGWDKFEKYAKAVGYCMYAANFIMKGIELEKAEDYMDKSFATIPATDYYLTKAYIKLLQDKEEEADNWLRKYFENGKKRFVKLGIHSLFIKISPIEDIIINYLLGQYYFKKGTLDLAKKHLALAANDKFDIYYSNHAKEILQTLD